MRTNHVLIDYENVQPENLSGLEADCFRVVMFIGENQNKLAFPVVQAMQQLGERASYVKIAGNGSNALDFHIAYYLGRLAEQEPSAFFHVISRDGGFDPLIKHMRAANIYVQRSPSVAEIPLLKLTDAQVAKALAPATKQAAPLPAATKVILETSATAQLAAQELQLASAQPQPKSTLKPEGLGLAAPPQMRAKTAQARSHSILDEQVAAVVLNLQSRGSSAPKSVKTLLGTIACVFPEKLTAAAQASVLAVLQQRGLVRIAGDKVSYSWPRPS